MERGLTGADDDERHGSSSSSPPSFLVSLQRSLGIWLPTVALAAAICLLALLRTLLRFLGCCRVTEPMLDASG